MLIRTMVQLTEEQMKALKELAMARKTSVAKLVRESVAQYVVTATKDSDREEKRRRALEFIRKIKSGEIQSCDIEGKTDVARNHDKYLTEIYGTWKKSS
jgi:predicted transcriptional regulator